MLEDGGVPTLRYCCRRDEHRIETLGLMLIEAMTFGVPVLAPSESALAKVVTNGEYGFCIDSRDGAALTDAVLADDPECPVAMSHATHAGDFTFETYAAQLLHTSLPSVHPPATGEKL